MDALWCSSYILPINTHIFLKGFKCIRRTEILGFRVSVFGLGGVGEAERYQLYPQNDVGVT